MVQGIHPSYLPQKISSRNLWGQKFETVGASLGHWSQRSQGATHCAAPTGRGHAHLSLMALPGVRGPVPFDSTTGAEPSNANIFPPHNVRPGAGRMPVHITPGTRPAVEARHHWPTSLLGRLPKLGIGCPPQARPAVHPPPWGKAEPLQQGEGVKGEGQGRGEGQLVAVKEGEEGLPRVGRHRMGRRWACGLRWGDKHNGGNFRVFFIYFLVRQGVIPQN